MHADDPVFEKYFPATQDETQKSKLLLSAAADATVVPAKSFTSHEISLGYDPAVA